MSLRKAALALAVMLALPFAARSSHAPADRVGIDGGRSTYKAVFGQIEAQTGYTFAFSKSDFDDMRTVDIEALDGELGQVLSQIFADSGVSFLINQKHIILFPAKVEPEPEPEPEPVKAAPAPPVAAPAPAPVAPERPAPRPVVETDYAHVQYDDAIAIPERQAVSTPRPAPAPYTTPPASNAGKLPHRAKSPKYAVKTNLLYDMTSTANFGFEIKVAKRTTLDVSGNFNAWDFKDNSKLKHLLVQPELRFWWSEPFRGHFLSTHIQWSHFNFGNLPVGSLKDVRYQGDLFGAGIGYGYNWYLAPRWSLEASIGVGYNYLEYESFECARCGLPLGSEKRHYVGPTKLGLSISYIIK